MDLKVQAGIFMTTLSFATLLLVLTGVWKGMQKTAWTTGTRKSLFGKTILIMVGWIGIISLLGYVGFFEDLSLLPPRPLFLIILPLPLLLGIAFSDRGSELLMAIPPQWLIGMQAFRMLVEILLWRAFLSGLLPIQMTFEGYNFDGLSGILAIPFALMIRVKWSGYLTLLYNITGLGLLLNILVIAILSMPTPLRYFMNEPPNTLVGEYPFIYLPGILVVVAYGLHIFSLRQWWLIRKANKAETGVSY